MEGNRPLGGGFLDGYLGSSPDFSSITAAKGRVLTSITAGGFLEHWLVKEADDGQGEEMADGLFANPLRLSVEAAVNSINEKTGDVDLRVYSQLGDGDLLTDRSEITLTQSNPLPPASDYPARASIVVTVTESNSGIVTTHDASNGDSTTGKNGTKTGEEAGFIIEWVNGGSVEFISNGLDNWRY